MKNDLERRVQQAYQNRQRTVLEFFDREAERLAEVCYEMARRFHRGGRILAFGIGAAATDAQHISVEFVHPVIVGKRALPAIALPNDSPTLLGLSAEDPASLFSRSLDLLGRPEDIAIGMWFGGSESAAASAAGGLKQAKAKGLLTLGLSGPGNSLTAAEPDWAFTCDDPDPFVVQEVHETLYHVLWELVHVFFEHRGLLEEDPGGSRHDVGASAFLYPFLSATEKGLEAVLQQVRSSILLKAKEVVEVRAQQAERPGDLVKAAEMVATQIASGAKLLTFGNGGSATDAQDFVTDCMFPPPGIEPVPAISLTNEEAVVTAVGNDVGFENIFARQIIAYAEPGDIAVGISTSGGSRNHLAALEEARRRGLKTLALVGYGGGETIKRGLADAALTISHDYIPRIQEAQATQYHTLRRLVDDILLS